jgi:hypothetical protein
MLFFLKTVRGCFVGAQEGPRPASDSLALRFFAGDGGVDNRGGDGVGAGVTVVGGFGYLSGADIRVVDAFHGFAP